MEEIRKPRFLKENWGFCFGLGGVRRGVFEKAINLKSAKDLQ
jgi:hypothetical protein